jgi:hypothetical protein
VRPFKQELNMYDLTYNIIILVIDIIGILFNLFAFVIPMSRGKYTYMPPIWKIIPVAAILCFATAAIISISNIMVLISWGW